MNLAAEILKALLPPLIDAVLDMIKNKSDDETKTLRGQPIKISVAFGGGPGDSEKTLIKIEAKLPD
jgi:hypothetical protein